jgi:hypothetical protein
MIDVSPKPPFPECYLGDAVYASFDGYQIWLRTTDGITDTNRIALEPSVLDALRQYVEALRAHYASEGETP